MDDKYGELLTKVLVAVITAALPILLFWLKQWLNQKKALLIEKIGEQRWYQLQVMAKLFCEAAEQAGVWDSALELGEQKKAWVLERMQEWLDGEGLAVDMGAIDAAIEAAVYNYINERKPKAQAVKAEG